MHIGTDHKLSEENQSMILFWNARHNQLLKPLLKIAKKKRKVIYISNVCGLFKENSCVAQKQSFFISIIGKTLKDHCQAEWQ